MLVKRNTKRRSSINKKRVTRRKEIMGRRRVRIKRKRRSRLRIKSIWSSHRIYKTSSQMMNCLRAKEKSKSKQKRNIPKNIKNTL
jgi:hypothetical protein